MKSLYTVAIMPALLGCSLAHAELPAVYPGAKAPELSIKRWIKDRFEADANGN